MSMQENWNQEIPPDTAHVGGDILAEDDPYRLVGDGVNNLLCLENFRDLYSKLGRGAVCPIILSLITVFQFLENIPDRVAARWVVTRIDWKYALHLPLSWLGFHFSDLSNFRQRLLEHGAEALVFEQVLKWVRSCGFLKKYGKQRSDSSHIVGCVEQLSRLELVWETLRLALRAVKTSAPAWYEQTIPAAFHEVYAERQSDWRLSDEEAALALEKAGSDGFWLLDHLTESPQGVLDLPEVATLRTVWEQQFVRQTESEKVIVRQPPIKGKELIVSPHDPEARWAEKRGQDWVGYRLEVTETAEDEVGVQFITDIDVVAANTGDNEAVDGIQERLIARELKPQEQYTDQGFTSGANLAHSAQRGIELVGPVPTNPGHKPQGYQQSDFQLDFEAQQAVCPQGRCAVVWRERPEPDGRVGIEIGFREQCAGCPVRAQCASGQSGRTLTISPYHEELSRRRLEQETRVFKERMKRRAAIEGTISELTRKHGARRARYRGTVKVRLQMLFTGAATDLKRLVRALTARKQMLAGAVAGC
jgi:transposase